jgi:uncharacterized integral membrane protein
MSYVVVALVAVAVAVFALQNSTTVTVQFIVWKVEQVPLAAVVLVSLAAGVVMIGLPLYFQLWRTRRSRRTQSGPGRFEDYEDQPPRS